MLCELREVGWRHPLVDWCVIELEADTFRKHHNKAEDAGPFNES